MKEKLITTKQIETMNIRAEITTTEIVILDGWACVYHCQLEINGKWKGDLYGETREELKSLCEHLEAIPEFVKCVEALSKLLETVDSIKHADMKKLGLAGIISDQFESREALKAVNDKLSG